MNRLLFVISRHEVERYQLLKRTFADADSVEIVLDRRFGQRRRRHDERSAERRRNGDRRTRDVMDDVDRLGWAILRRDLARDSAADRAHDSAADPERP